MAKVSAKSVGSGGILAIKNGNFYFYQMELKVLDNGQKLNTSLILMNKITQYVD